MATLNYDSTEVNEKLKEFLDSGLKDALNKGLENACLIIETEAKKLCPVDDGQLRQSITHEVDAEDAEGQVGTDVEYAPYVEIGTGIYSTKGTGRKDQWTYQDAKGEWHKTRGRKPKPFLEPAAEGSTEKILKSFERLV